MRDVEAVVALERDEQVVARDSGDLLRLEAEELADAVVLVDDEVADAQLREGLQRPPEARLSARGALAEDLAVREEDEAELAPDEAAAGRSDGEVEPRVARERGAVLQQRGLELAQQVLRAERLAAVRERDDDAVAATDEALQLLLGLGEPAGSERRALRLERERLTRRKRVELRG